MPLFLRERADLRVQPLGVGAELGHVAHHQNRFAGFGRERRDRGRERARIRVVAVVDQHRAGRMLAPHQTAGDGGRGFETRADRRERHIERGRDRGGGERVHHVVATGLRQRDRRRAGRRAQREAAARVEIVAPTSAFASRPKRMMRRAPASSTK